MYCGKTVEWIEMPFGGGGLAWPIDEGRDRLMGMEQSGVSGYVAPRASVSLDYWGYIKEDWGSRGRASVWDLGDKSPRSLSFFCETIHNICIKVQQTTVVAVTG